MQTYIIFFSELLKFSVWRMIFAVFFHDGKIYHRSFDNFMVNLLGALAVYCFFPKKPCIACEWLIDNQLTLF